MLTEQETEALRGRIATLIAAYKWEQERLDSWAKGNATDRDHSEHVMDGVRTFNRVEHRKGTITSISNAANAHRGQSPYFESLDAVIDLENGVRDYIEDFLLHDPVVGTDGA